jgi:hypothetical protein
LSDSRRLPTSAGPGDPGAQSGDGGHREQRGDDDRPAAAGRGGLAAGGLGLAELGDRGGELDRARGGALPRRDELLEVDRARLRALLDAGDGLLAGGLDRLAHHGVVLEVPRRELAQGGLGAGALELLLHLGELLVALGDEASICLATASWVLRSPSKV